MKLVTDMTEDDLKAIEARLIELPLANRSHAERELIMSSVPALIAEVRRLREELHKVSVLSRAVMNGFEKHGASIWPHYSDNDDNDAEFLRQRVQNILGDWQPMDRDIALARPEND